MANSISKFTNHARCQNSLKTSKPKSKGSCKIIESNFAAYHGLLYTSPTSDEFSGCVQVAPSGQPFFTIEESKWVAKRNPLMNEFLSLNAKHGWSAQPTTEDFT